MTALAPAEESTQLYNDLIRTPYAEQGRVRSVVWRLRALHRAKPNDLKIAVALLQGFVMSGSAVEACDLADSLWARKNAIDLEVTRTFLVVLGELGEFTRSMTLLKQFPNMDEDVQLIGTLFHNAFGLGDVEQLQYLNARYVKHNKREELGTFLDWLRASSLDKHFPRHQRIVQEVLRRKTTTQRVGTVASEDTVDLLTYAFADMTRVERERLEKEIEAKLESYYRSASVDPVTYVSRINTIVLPIAAAPLNQVS